MDGAGYFKIFFRISLPQLRPALSALGIITFTQTWNYYFQARVLLEPQESMTLPVAMDLLRGYLGIGQSRARHGGDEHGGAAGHPALPARAEDGDRRHRHERHQELRDSMDALRMCKTSNAAIDDALRLSRRAPAACGVPARRHRHRQRLADRQRPARRLEHPQPARHPPVQRLQPFRHQGRARRQADRRPRPQRPLRGTADRIAEPRASSTASDSAPTATRWPASRISTTRPSSDDFRSPRSSSSATPSRARCG